MKEYWEDEVVDLKQALTDFVYHRAWELDGRADAFRRLRCQREVDEEVVKEFILTDLMPAAQNLVDAIAAEEAPEGHLATVRSALEYAKKASYDRKASDSLSKLLGFDTPEFQAMMLGKDKGPKA